MNQISENTSNNKRIAKNTLFLYLRMLVVMGVTLFTSRIVLAALGVADYGIYILVMGLSSSFMFFSSSLTNSIQRYLTFELGKGNLNGVNIVFNTSLLLYFIISVICAVLGILFAPRIVNDYLNIPQERILDTIFVFYAFIIQFSLTMVFSVYESVLIARENMKIYAYLGLFDAFSKLIIAYFITLSANRLVFFSIVMTATYTIEKLLLLIYCRIKYPECKIRYNYDTNTLKGIISLGGWSIYGSSAWLINNQGLNYLINIFFGTVMNAAMGIANQINTAINNFCINFYTAVRPQIIKYYSKGEFDKMLNLIYNSSRFSMYLLCFLCFPVLIDTKYILGLWLGNYPPNSEILVRWILIFSVVNSMANPVWTAIMATNDVKKTVLYSSTVFLLAMPAGFVLILLGFNAYWLIVCLCVFRLISILIMLFMLGRIIKISTVQYISNSICRSAIVFVPAFLSMSFVRSYIEINILSFIILTLIGMLLCLASIYFVGIKPKERLMVRNKLITYFRKNET